MIYLADVAMLEEGLRSSERVHEEACEQMQEDMARAAKLISGAFASIQAGMEGIRPRIVHPEEQDGARGIPREVMGG